MIMSAAATVSSTSWFERCVEEKDGEWWIGRTIKGKRSLIDVVCVGTYTSLYPIVDVLMFSKKRYESSQMNTIG